MLKKMTVFLLIMEMFFIFGCGKEKKVEISVLYEQFEKQQLSSKGEISKSIGYGENEDESLAYYFGKPQQIKTKEYRNFNYSVVNDKIIITGYIGKNPEIIIPEEIENKTVIGIAMNSFKDLELTKVIFPNTIEHIGMGAFYKNYLGYSKEVILPTSLKVIGEGAFAYNPIEKIDIPENVETIGRAAFYDTNLINIKFPNSIRIIGSWAFASSYLKEAEISENVEIIEESAFHHHSIRRGHSLIIKSVKNSVAEEYVKNYNKSIEGDYIIHLKATFESIN